MSLKYIVFILLGFFSPFSYSQSYPVFGPEIKVSITGLTFDAMEPFISPDGNTLFFNSLNSGGNTNLYYATKVNDSIFNFVGIVEGSFDPSPQHLDAVASLDGENNFYWVSLRNIPNLHRGIYLEGSLNNISPVYGDFNILSPTGWLIMDAAIDYSGDRLYYSNAYFGPTYTECVDVPCEAQLGVAEMINDSTFHKVENSDVIFSNINDTNYIVYAPQVTQDGLELYYTRLLIGGVNTEICVSTRNSMNDSFGLPEVIYSNFGYFPEAASPTADKQIIYYHQKNESLIFGIYLRYRMVPMGESESILKEDFTVYPNPVSDIIHFRLPVSSETPEIVLYSAMGVKILSKKSVDSIDMSNLPDGVYLLVVQQNNDLLTAKIIKN